MAQGPADHRRRHRSLRLDGGWTLTAEGTTNWTNGYIYFGYNPVGTSIGGTNTLVNAAKATFDDQNTAGYEIIQYTGTGIFDNAGLFDKTVASGASTTTVSTVFNNQSTGTVKVDAGTLSLTGGGTETGAFIVAAGATLEFDGGSFALNNASAISSSGTLQVGGGTVSESGTLSDGGTLEITGGTLTATGTITAASFSQSGGSLADTGTLTVSGTAVLSGGGMEGGSKSAVQGALVAQGPLIIAGGTTALDGGWTLTAEGTTNWTNGYIYFGYNPVGTSIGGTNTLVNAAKATFDDQNTAGYEIIQYTGTGIFDNAGLFDKTVASGASTTTVSTVFNNQSTGTVKVDAGTLSLTGDTANSGILEAQGGVLEITTAITGAGRLSIGTGAEASEIELGGATSETVVFNGTAATLKLDQPATYTGTLSGFAAGDILDLASTNAVSATPGAFNGTTTPLTVALNGGGTLTYTLAGNYSSDRFSTSLNGSDTDIAVITKIPPPPVLFITAPAAATVGVGRAEAIPGVSLSQSPTTSGETFTVTVSDTNGLLSATGTGVSGTGTTSLTISSSLSQVNSDLATLTDKDAATASDTIKLTASDSNGGHATPATIAVTVSSVTITVPRAQIVEIANVTPISGISVAATGNASGETFKLTLSDTLGALSANTDATGGGGSITGSGTATLVISGTLAEVDADLSTFTYLASTAGTDTIHIATADTSGGRSNQQLAVTVDHPAVAAFRKVSGAGELTQNGNAYTLDFGTIGQGVTAPTVVIDVLNAATGPADMLSGSFSVAGEAAPYNALVDIGLNAIRPLAAGAASGQTEVLFQSEITGSFAETLTLAATGSNANGYSASLGTKSLTIEGTIAPPSGRVFDLTTGPDTFVEPPRGSDNTVIATSNTLSAGDDIDSGGGGGNILVLQGSGVFNMTLPGALADFDKVTAQEGQPSYEDDGVVYVSQTQTVDLRRALDATVDVAPASINSANPNAPTITIVGATDDNSTINLASGNDTVTLGAAQETVHGGGGSNTFYVNAVTIGATINGGSGTNVLDVTGGGTMAMGANIKQIADAVLIGSSIPYDFTANAVSGLLINDLGTRTADTLIAGGSNQILTGGGAGKLTVNAANQTDVLLKDTAALFTGDTVEDLVKGDMIDITGLAFSAAHTSLGFAFNKVSDTTTMSVAVSGTQKTAITLLGQYMASDFKVSADTAGTGTLITLIHELNLTMPH